MKIPFQGDIFVKNGKIVSLTENVGYVRIYNEQNNYFYQDAYAYSGLTDHHGHIAGFGRTLSIVNFKNCRSAEECCERALKSNQTINGWIFGYGWNQENWLIKELPNRFIIDEYLSDIPTFFIRIDGHTAWVNSKALSIAGIGTNSVSPKGGSILLDKSGNPTGILIDNAMELMTEVIPKMNVENVRNFIIRAIDELVKFGITEVDDMDVDPDYINIYKELDKTNSLKIKVKSYIKAQKDEYLKKNIYPESYHNFEIKGLKFYSDGALGSYGAALIKPYSDKKDTCGLLLINENELFNKAKIGIENGFSIATHSIGDMANRLVIDVYSKLFKHYGTKQLNLRIEHSQIVHPDDLTKIKKMSDAGNRIIASVQPIHCVSDAKMARKRLGRRTNYSYPWKSIKEAGAILMFGSDFPIESPDPIRGIDALVNRIPIDESKVWYPKERLSIEESLSGYQSEENFSDNRLNPIRTNISADITILNNNLISLKPQNIKQTEVLGVFVNGMKVL